MTCGCAYTHRGVVRVLVAEVVVVRGEQPPAARGARQAAQHGARHRSAI